MPDYLVLLDSGHVLTLTICSSFSQFQITVLSSNGTNLTPLVPILHSQIPLSTLQRRYYTVPIRQCPADDTYLTRSWCQHEVSAQDFGTVCVEPQQTGRTNPQQRTHIGKGKCASDEICVGSNAVDQEVLLQAYCVSTNRFVRIGRNPSNGNRQNVGSSGVVTASFNSNNNNNNNNNNNGSYLAVEAVVTSLNKKSSLFAASVVIQAQTYDGVWRTVADGHSYCLRCSSVSLAPFPVTAQRVKVDVVMPEWNPTGLLWLASYPY